MNTAVSKSEPSGDNIAYNVIEPSWEKTAIQTSEPTGTNTATKASESHYEKQREARTSQTPGIYQLT